MQVAIRKLDGVKALIGLVEDCLPALDKELASARRVSIMAAAQVPEGVSIAQEDPTEGHGFSTSLCPASSDHTY